jgi:integrase
MRDKRLYKRGRFIWARVPDEHGRIVRVTTGCTDERAASLWADERERSAADPAYRRAAETSLGSAMSDYAADVLVKRSAATQSKVRCKLGHFVRLWGASWPLTRITGDLVLAYIRTRDGEGVKPLTVKDELTALRGVLKLARFKGTFARDLATVFPPHFSGKYKPRTRAPSPAEVRKLLAAMEPRRAAHVAFLVATGARLGESRRARRIDVTDGLVHLRGTKTAGALRDVPITSIGAPLLAFALENAPGKDVLFDPWGKYHRDIRAACVRAGIEPVSPNDLRRSFATWHRQAGVTAEELSMLLGHATDTLAQTTYGRISGADLGERLRSRVPNLYATTTETAPTCTNMNDESVCFTASPVRLERTTPALGKRAAQCGRGVVKIDSRRASARVVGLAGVPVPYWVTEASGNLLARMAGVA